MTLIKNEDHGATAPGVPDPKALTCTLEQSSSYRKAKDTVRVSRGRTEQLDISFQRTIRVPDGKGDSELPPCMGTFPLYSVANYAEKLPKDMAAKGGLFLPMYRMFSLSIALTTFRSKSKTETFQSVRRCGSQSDQKCPLPSRSLSEV